jgi:FAD/FMN-containing dehydrogenase
VLIEPFFKDCFTSTVEVAWPPVPTSDLHVIELIIQQPDAAEGHAEENAAHLREAAKRIAAAAQKEGIRVLSKYPNYALHGTPAVEFYGGKLDLLKDLKKRYDPSDRFNKGSIEII